jgi:hypothetical protein
MTPKEKAKELVQQFKGRGMDGDENYAAKECALIVVNEVLNAITFNMYDEDAYDKENSFWEAVKLELENI